MPVANPLPILHFNLLHFAYFAALINRSKDPNLQDFILIPYIPKSEAFFIVFKLIIDSTRVDPHALEQASDWGAPGTRRAAGTNIIRSTQREIGPQGGARWW